MGENSVGPLATLERWKSASRARLKESAAHPALLGSDDVVRPGGREDSVGKLSMLRASDRHHAGGWRANLLLLRRDPTQTIEGYADVDIAKSSSAGCLLDTTDLVAISSRVAAFLLLRDAILKGA